jgi:hypothetical protein
MKQCLFRDWQGLSFVIFALLGAVAVASSGPAWLPAIGPAPLRFSPVPRPFICRIVLPVSVPVPEPAPVVLPVGNPAPVPRAAPSVVIPQAANTVAPPPVETPAPEPVVSPQMFLKYFTKSTNDAPSVAAPQATESYPSRASYEIGP